MLSRNFHPKKIFEITQVFNFELIGKKSLEFAYFFLMISGQGYVIHINDDNSNSLLGYVFYKQNVVKLTLEVTKPLYSIGKTIKPSSRRFLETI